MSESNLKRYERLGLNPITGWPTPKTKVHESGIKSCKMPKKNTNGFSAKHN